MGSFATPTPASSEQLSNLPTSMSLDVLTRPVTRTETLGLGLLPVLGSPLFLSASATAWIPEQRKRPREDDEEATESRKRLCRSPSPELCVYCKCTPVEDKDSDEEESEKNKENCNPSASATIPSVPTPPPAPLHANITGLPATKRPADPRSMCKSAKTKSVLTKESSKGVFRPQPFRRFPTTKNAERITMRNNLRDIFLGKKTRPTNVRYARDAPPRPRLRGTYASNASHRGPLSQPVTKRKYHYRLSRISAEYAGLPEVLDPSIFLGSGGADRDWRKWVEPVWVADEGSVPEWRLQPRGEGMPVRVVPFRIERRRGVPRRMTVFVDTSPRARDDWGRKEAALRALVRRRAREAEKAGRPKLESRRRGPDGKPKPILPFPLVFSKLRVELGRGGVEGGDEDSDTTEGDAPTVDRTEVKED